MPETSRPLGVTLVALLIVVAGIGLVFRGVMELLSSDQGSADTVVAVVLLVVGVAYVLVAKGIFNGNWSSRLIVSILSLVAMIGSVITLVDPEETVISIVQIVAAVVILALLYGGRARQFFS